MEKRLPTIDEILKEHKNALFTLIRENGEEIFAHPLTAAQVHEGLDKNYLGCCVSKIKSEDLLGFEFLTCYMRF